MFASSVKPPAWWVMSTAVTLSGAMPAAPRFVANLPAAGPMVRSAPASTRTVISAHCSANALITPANGGRRPAARRMTSCSSDVTPTQTPDGITGLPSQGSNQYVTDVSTAETRSLSAGLSSTVGSYIGRGPRVLNVSILLIAVVIFTLWSCLRCRVTMRDKGCRYGLLSAVSTKSCEPASERSPSQHLRFR